MTQTICTLLSDKYAVKEYIKDYWPRICYSITWRMDRVINGTTNLEVGYNCQIIN